MEITIILSSLIFCLSSVLQKTKNCCDLLRVSSPISSYSFALRWNLSREEKLFVSMILSLIFSPSEKTKIVAIILAYYSTKRSKQWLF